jgi:hypothetical protein
MPASAAESISHIRAAFPEQGFFQDKEWVLSPEAFALDKATVELIRDLGPALRAFQRACNRCTLMKRIRGWRSCWIRASRSG